MSVQKSTTQKKPTEFKVCTWNVLADCCCNDSDGGFPYVSAKARDPYERAEKQFLVIILEKPDILALQEVDKPKRFQPFLEEIGYEVTWFQRHDSPLGTMLAIKKSSIEFSFWDKRSLPENRFMIGVCFYFQKKLFEFWTTHLKAKAEGEQARIEQTTSIGSLLNQLNVNYIVAGDFNDHPKSKCVAEMHNAGFRDASAEHIRMQPRSYTTYKTRRNANGAPIEQKKIEDYIFFKGPDIVLTGAEEGGFVSWATENKRLTIVSPGLPSEQFPSDHLPVNSRFAIKSKDQPGF